ncbi:hypothetical protein ASE74_10015 [Pedobacter sp. Leaf216]|uniref:hypothetical protein n=1 Tax=Pedobacter sp. Leaf216 TaxID=1735684 RepID=UPI0006F26BA9|nr:hypothetical protein [Pedobacter sp. Leaf216]KQM65197.1 hypothetical protein ASE74_10015 [Pedobacter sp. Leaf216]
MPRRKNNISIQKNRIKEVVKTSGASQRLVAIWLDVNYTTVSSWNSNVTQPEAENLNKIGELVEIDNRMLYEPQGRVNTGFAEALESELQRLNKIEGISYEVEKFDKKKGGTVKVNNPELVKRLRKFAEAYKKS